MVQNVVVCRGFGNWLNVEAVGYDSGRAKRCPGTSRTDFNVKTCRPTALTANRLEDALVYSTEHRSLQLSVAGDNAELRPYKETGFDSLMPRTVSDWH